MAEDGRSSPTAETLPTRAGYVALIGMPNAGKSSLLNQLLGHKLSIVTPLSQTTRERVVGIDTRDGVQMIFVDTPGLVEPRYLLHRSMLHAALEAIPDADVVLLVVDSTRPPSERNAELLPRGREASLIVVANKTDIASATDVAAVRHWAEETFHAPTAPVSSVTGEGIDHLRGEIAKRLPVSPLLYPPDEVSSQSVRFFVAELIRETAFELYRQEIPYSVAVRIEDFQEDVDPIRIRATIYVERASQKGILIGQGGSGIRDLGQQARHKIESFLDQRVHLELWVKVLPRWRKDALTLRRLGFPVPPDVT